MNTNIIQFLALKSAPSTVLLLTKPSSTIEKPAFPPRPRRFVRVSPTNCSSGDGGGSPVPPPRVTPPDTVEIRFRRGSRRRTRQQQGREDDASDGVAKKVEASDRPKEWEAMSIPEKAIELYMGEKGLLFWLNKLAYASIFTVIGGWIFFRFVGPALNLYQLDSPPLSPSSMFKGS